MDRSLPLRCLRDLPATIMLSLVMLSPLAAHELSISECKEGADYIRNAAISRDHGISEAKFMQIFETDMRMIQAVPKELRWFVQDEEDEAFLRAQLDEVFNRPQPPQQHAKAFGEACVLRTEEWRQSGMRRI